MNQSKLLLAVVVMQGLVLASQWTGSSVPVASAQIPDSGQQRLQTVEELKSLNAKMEKLIGILESGKLQVQANLPDERK